MLYYNRVLVSQALELCRRAIRLGNIAKPASLTNPTAISFDADGNMLNGPASGTLANTDYSRASIPGGVAVEGRYSDSNSVDRCSPHVNILLHVADGQMRTLERCKDDGSPIKKEPNPAELQRRRGTGALQGFGQYWFIRAKIRTSSLTQL
jgi:hypothetical protein